MDNDLTLDMSGMKIFFGGQELKAVKEITIPPDVELSGDLSKGHINAFPNEAYGSITLKPRYRLRWRNIRKAYRLMGEPDTGALLKILRDYFVEVSKE